MLNAVAHACQVQGCHPAAGDACFDHLRLYQFVVHHDSRADTVPARSCRPTRRAPDVSAARTPGILAGPGTVRRFPLPPLPAPGPGRTMRQERTDRDRQPGMRQRTAISFAQLPCPCLLHPVPHPATGPRRCNDAMGRALMTNRHQQERQQGSSPVSSSRRAVLRGGLSSAPPLAARIVRSASSASAGLMLRRLPRPGYPGPMLAAASARPMHQGKTTRLPATAKPSADTAGVPAPRPLTAIALLALFMACMQ